MPLLVNMWYRILTQVSGLRIHSGPSTHRVQENLPIDIFYSKDRVEEVVEVEDEPISGSMTVKGQQDNEELHYKILPKGAWMSGCPEMGELRAFACVRCLEALTTESFRS